jgi:hypothetical protein
MSHLNRYEIRAGPIAGLYLPFATWRVLLSAGITTLDQLRAVADRLETLPGIGPKTAQIIREELARVAASRKPPE